MRGYPNFNFPAFYKAARDLREMGHEVFSPAEKDDDIYGTQMAETNATGDEHEATKSHGFDIRRTMEIDCTWICRNADGIALLPGWEGSRGVKAEKALAEAIGILQFKMVPWFRIDGSVDYYTMEPLVDGER